MSKFCANCGYRFEEYDSNHCPLCGSTSWKSKVNRTKNSGNGKKIGMGVGIGIGITAILLIFVFQMEFTVINNFDSQPSDNITYTGCTMITDGTTSAKVTCENMSTLSLVRDLPLKKSEVDNVSLIKKGNFYKVEFETPLGIPIAYVLTNPNYMENISLELDVQLKEIEIPEVEFEKLKAQIPEIDFSKTLQDHSYFPDHQKIVNENFGYMEETLSESFPIENPFPDDGIYQISYENIPEYADKDVTLSALNKAIRMWEETNPDLKFEIVDGYADIYVKWSKDLGPDMDGYQQGNVIKIEMGSYDCKNKWKIYSQTYVGDMIAHEIGHYLGLGHHQSESHLMYGLDEFTEQNFDDHGYNIPHINTMFVEWEESISIKQSIDRFPSVIYNEYQYRQGMQLIKQYNCFLG